MHLSCTEKEYISSNSKTFIIDISDTKDILYSQLFDTCYIIPLESSDDALIGDISKVILNNNNIIIFDNFKTKSVFIYDLYGKLKNVIHNEGEGPSEYIAPMVLSVSESGEKVYIMDSMGGKQVTYNLDGKFINQIKLFPEIRYVDLLVKDESFYTANLTEVRQKYINKYDKNFNLIDKIEVSFNDDIWLENGIKPGYFYNKFDGSGFYYKGFRTNRILNIENDSIIEDINFKFPDNSFTFNTDVPIELSKFHEILNRNNHYVVGEQIIDSKSIMFIDIMKGSDISMAIYDKIKQKVQLVDYLVNDMDGVISEFTGMPVRLSNANYFITMVYPRFFNSKLNKGHIDGLYKEILQNITLKDTDNPILFIYPIKENIDDL
jgi:hypothetical protein